MLASKVYYFQVGLDLFLTYPTPTLTLTPIPTGNQGFFPVTVILRVTFTSLLYCLFLAIGDNGCHEAAVWWHVTGRDTPGDCGRPPYTRQPHCLKVLGTRLQNSTVTSLSLLWLHFFLWRFSFTFVYLIRSTKASRAHFHFFTGGGITYTD